MPATVVTTRDYGSNPVPMEVVRYNDGTQEVSQARPGLAITWSDHSGTITAGGTAQNAAGAADPAGTRRALRIRNPDTETEKLWVSFTGTASATGISSGSFDLDPGDEYEEAGTHCTQQAISLVAGTTGHKFFCQTGA